MAVAQQALAEQRAAVLAAAVAQVADLAAAVAPVAALAVAVAQAAALAVAVTWVVVVAVAGKLHGLSLGKPRLLRKAGLFGAVDGGGLHRNKFSVKRSLKHNRRSFDSPPPS
jgi:hypothetical protein